MVNFQGNILHLIILSSKNLIEVIFYWGMKDRHKINKYSENVKTLTAFYKENIWAA